ncbi:MAG: LPP20 family lipoprotein [Pseudomonadales bacterium]|nr:LPP20 family lipoprotein [Pseudomonadales bacterium]
MKYLGVFLMAIAVPAFADDYVEWVGANSGVNWSEGQMQAEGAGIAPDNAPPGVARMMACRAAVVDAQRNLVESIQGVRVQGTTVVANMMVESDTIKTTVDGVLKGAQVVKREPKDDGSCVVQMVAPMGGKFAKDIYASVYDNNKTAGATTRDILGQLVDRGVDFLVPAAYAEPARVPQWQDAFEKLAARVTSIEELLSHHPQLVETSEAGPTGLVIDARGSNFIPSMSPRIRKLRAGIIYPNEAHQIARRDRGQLVSLFTRDVDTAMRHPVVGERPLVLKGLRTFGDTRTEIVLDTDTSERLEKLVDAGFLKDAGVIIVL